MELDNQYTDIICPNGVCWRLRAAANGMGTYEVLVTLCRETPSHQRKLFGCEVELPYRYPFVYGTIQEARTVARRLGSELYRGWPVNGEVKDWARLGTP